MIINFLAGNSGGGSGSTPISTAITSASTNTEAAGAKAVYDSLGAYQATSGMSAYTLQSNFETHSGNTNIHTDLTEKALWNSVSGKQDTLISGSNIKTINNQSLLGSGDITISGGGSSNIVEVTQAEYDALVSGGTVDPDALYIITDASEINLSGYVQTSAITTAVTSGSTNAEIPTALAVYAATSGGGTTYSAGTNISIDTANTINCTIPITITDRGGNIIMVRGGGTGSNTFGVNTNNSFVFGSSNSIGPGGATKSNIYVFGNNNSSKNNFGITVGARLTSNSDYECSFGQYNVSNYVSSNFGNSGNTTLSIGNGYNSYTHNAFEIRQNGDIYFPDTDNTTYANFYQKPMVRLQDMYAALGGLKFVSLTQAEYNALVTKDSTTIYFIKDNSN